MLVDKEKCVGCEKCIPYCPVSALSFNGEVAIVDFDQCVECGVCLRADVCVTGAIYQQELEWPRTVRSILSNVLTIAPESQISGRGTEEMKTNELTGRFKQGFAGIGIELGRPGVACRIYDLEKVASAVAELDIEFEKINPTTSLMTDAKTGKMKKDVLNERVLSAILEFVIPNSKIPRLIEILKLVEKKIDTVFSLDIICKVEEDDSLPAIEIAKKETWVSINGKTNLGLGRPN